MDAQSLLNGLNSPVLVTAAASLGAGAALREITGWVGKAIAVLGSPQGKAIEGDIAQALPVVLKILADSGHPAAPALASSLTSVIGEIQAVAPPSTPPPPPATSTTNPPQAAPK